MYIKRINQNPQFIDSLTVISITLAGNLIIKQSMTEKSNLLKELCIKQNKQFKEWTAAEDYSAIHCAHYDWWAFPLNRNSSYGDKYKLFPADLYYLQKDQQFLQTLRSNAILVCRAWGYDLQTGKDISNAEKDQQWQEWPVRLYKMAGSLSLFSQDDLLEKAVDYAFSLIEKGYDFTYGPKDLKPFFVEKREWFHQMKKQPHSSETTSRDYKQQPKVESSQPSPNVEIETKQQVKPQQVSQKSGLSLSQSLQTLNLEEKNEK